MTLIEHLITATWFPLPKPFLPDFTVDSTCIWHAASGQITLAQQRRGLHSLFQLSQHLLTSSFSLPPSPNLQSSLLVTQLAILSCFDALARIYPSDGVSAFTRALSGKVSEADESKPYLLNLCAWNGLLLEEVVQRLVITSPEICVGRGTPRVVT
jgi:hypothetical protein